MKKLIVALGVTVLVSQGCIKTETAPTVVGPTDSLITSAKSYFEQIVSKQTSQLVVNSVHKHGSPRTGPERNADWGNAHVVAASGVRMVVVPIQFRNTVLVGSNFSGQAIYSLGSLLRLVLWQDHANQMHSLLLSFFPDSTYKPDADFRGIVFIDSWSGSPISKFKFRGNGQTFEFRGTIDTVENSQVSINSNQNKSVAPNLAILETCYQIVGYNYSADDPSEIYPWVEPAGCEYSYINVGGAIDLGGGLTSGSLTSAVGGGGGSGGIKPAAVLVIPGGNNLIGKISDYNKCFTNSAGADHQYQVTVCVDQPVPGKRTAWGLNLPTSVQPMPVNVGHTFLVFTESVASGVVVKRNQGFYPSGGVNPLSPSSPGAMNNDDQHGFNVSLTITVTGSQFFNMLGYVSNNSNDVYNINSFNCTTFALRTLYAAGVVLPMTIGSWTGGSGNDPGDLGEDIRYMTLGPNMVRNFAFSSHPNLGTCY